MVRDIAIAQARSADAHARFTCIGWQEEHVLIRCASLLRLNLELVYKRGGYLVILFILALDTTETDKLAICIAFKTAQVSLFQRFAPAMLRWVQLVVVLLILVVIGDGEDAFKDGILFFLVFLL